jgi:hypothetical protein
MRVMRAVLYTRVSSDDQTKGYSLVGQLRELRDHVAVHAWEVVEEVSDPASEVVARLDPEKRYGLWWYNRRAMPSGEAEVDLPIFEGSSAGENGENSVRMGDQCS